MKAITLTILIALMVLCGISYPPKTSNAEAVKIESPLQMLQQNETVIRNFEIRNDSKVEAVLYNLVLIDSLNNHSLR